MSIVTIASAAGADGRGGMVAELVSARLEYQLLNHTELLREVAGQRNVDQKNVQKAFQRPLLLGPSRALRQQWIVSYQAALLSHILEDSVVHHGPVGHLWLTGISHVLRVQVTADPERRTAWLAEETGMHPRRAKRAVRTQDSFFDNWIPAAPGGGGAEAFDLIVDIGEKEPAEAAGLISETAGQRRFLPMTFSTSRLREAALASRVRVELVGFDPDVQVRVEGGSVFVRTTMARGKERVAEEMRQRILAVQGVERADMQVVRDVLEGYAGTGR